MIRVHPAKKILKFIVRNIPIFGAIAKPGARPQGISAMFRVWNECSYVEPSINSIKDLVDEIIVVDSYSTDGSWEIAGRLAAECPKIKLIRCSGHNMWENSNLALRASTFRWILKWDADFIAMRNGGFEEFRDYLYSLNPERHYYINPTLIEVTGDMYHQNPYMPIRQDIETYIYSEKLNYVPVHRIVRKDARPDWKSVEINELEPDSYDILFEAPFIPLVYDVRLYAKPMGFHLNVKSARQHFMRHFFSRWVAELKKGKNLDLDAFIEHCIKEEWKLPDVLSAEKLYMNLYCKQLVQYKGELPDAVAEIAAKSPYRVVYEDGRIIGRNDTVEK
jgi:glycosyltransferase involved in cell wall biosynthesis